MLNMSSVADFFLGISRKYLEQPFHIKEHLWMSVSDDATLKLIFGGSKPSSKLTLKTKWYHSCGCCNDSRSCEQLKKLVQINIF